MGTTTVYGGSAQIATNDSNITDLAGGVNSDAIDSVGTLETVSGLTVVEKGNAAIHKTILTLVEVSLASTDGATPLNDGAWGTDKLYTFPEGQVTIYGAHMISALGGIAAVTGGGGGFLDTANIEVGVGTVASAQEAVFGLGNGTQEDIIDALDVDLTAKTSNAAESTAVTTPATYDGSGTATSVNLNYRTLGDGDHGVAADALLISGTITVIWSVLGDN